ncbi:MAG: YqeG family HAD IIIA-type phosphatase [Lachnospiraceae bacterium]|nr:YqeG family HAD IIIA-type phosphatase [Lachnospiraceae bacterium]
MFKNLYPKEDWDSAYSSEYERLYEQGYRGLIFDIDNTLVEHGAKADKRAIALVDGLRRMGFAICFLSNNEKERVGSFCKPLDAAYIYKAGKPKRSGYEAAMKLIGTTKEQTAAIGDQLFTDIWGANRAGIYTVLVKQIGKKEEFQIVLKRYLEKVVLHFYRKQKAKGREDERK